MGHTSKYDEVSTAADELENVEEVELPGNVGELQVTWSEAVNKRKGRGPSRAVRRDNATAALDAAIEALREYGDDEEHSEDERDAATAAADELESAKDAAENAEFPGMYS